jgi:hypothetical protein
MRDALEKASNDNRFAPSLFLDADKPDLGQCL